MKPWDFIQGGLDTVDRASADGLTIKIQWNAVDGINAYSFGACRMEEAG